MTVVNPKSISGINSITMASGSDDLLTIHSNNTTERVRVNNSGNVIIGSGVTLSPDGDVFATGISTFTGLVDANGGAHIDNLRLGIDADNDITTSAGNLTLDSAGGNVVINDNLDVDGTTTVDGDLSVADKIVHTGDVDTNIRFSGADTIDAETGGSQRVRITSGGQVNIGGDFTQTDRALAVTGSASFKTTEADIWLESTGPNAVWRILGSTGGNTHRFRIYDNTNGKEPFYIEGSSGSNTQHVHVNSGNLVFDASGTGIDFSATSNSSGTMSNELLADYEEGTFSMTLTGSSSNPSYTTSSNTGHYVRVGNLVSLYFLMVVNGVSGQGSGNWQITGIPFSHSNNVNSYRSMGIIGYNDIFATEVHKCYINNSDNILIVPNGVTQSNQTYSQNALSTGYFSITITYITDS